MSYMVLSCKLPSHDLQILHICLNILSIKKDKGRSGSVVECST